ncbi:MAG: Asp23/Gls24 family envelope stress response protein [Clostridia bacterium]|nr:Asp23/Gls24 family envelope stress response protein [Clostridia bacterium]
MKIRNKNGSLVVSNDVIASICGYAATHCFGVKGIVARGVSDGIMQFLGVKNMSRGVKIRYDEGGISIELHVACEHGINMATIGSSIMNEVKFVIEHDTGVKVKNVDVCIDYVDASEEA